MIIDFPQVVSAAGNNAARAMLLRDVNNLRRPWARFAPGAAGHLVRRGDVGAVREAASCSRTAELTGKFVFDTAEADVDGVRESIDDARQEALIRQQGREAAAENAE